MTCAHHIWPDFVATQGGGTKMTLERLLGNILLAPQIHQEQYQYRARLAHFLAPAAIDICTVLQAPACPEPRSLSPRSRGGEAQSLPTAPTRRITWVVPPRGTFEAGRSLRSSSFRRSPSLPSAGGSWCAPSMGRPTSGRCLERNREKEAAVLPPRCPCSVAWRPHMGRMRTRSERGRVHPWAPPLGRKRAQVKI